MILYLLINRCDIMDSYSFLLLLGYLYFCIAINPIENSDWVARFPEISERYASLDNCTQCDVKQDSSCSCFRYGDKCAICCYSVSCCVCADCGMCRYTQQQLILMTQIGISILFGFGIVGLIVVYCKICNRTRQVARERRRLRVVLHEERDLVTQCSTIIEGLRDRPPSYNEVIRNASPVYPSSCAPPLYSSPYNRASMQEAPPSYPGTPKPQEKSRDSDELPSSLPVAQHM
ncbi:uncharacterized protein LOC112458042 isoform X1 [Temnothorax curvispinosus]|uniref:Uncharacterized protein LOC112458042 isoform X1 n=1 Tax=Temnothorax curvispinosus TaxID=300111 RepID=A0A6J1Q727_9HYME|nr:uncharacterized protein LOC112458042 isoform X1 [Temnothorax curvispinosus]